VDAISPFWHLPGVPVERFDPIPALVELLLAVSLVVLGLWGYRRRDIASN
jgi:ABC-2 type transport system permease protein